MRVSRHRRGTGHGELARRSSDVDIDVHQRRPGAYKYNVQPSGGGTALFSDATALIGIPNGTPAAQANGCNVGLDCDATPGSTVAGTALTAVVFPRSVAGSKAPQTAAFQVPAITFMWDKRPPRNPGT